MTGCLHPCIYSEFKIFGNPNVADLNEYGFQLSFAKAEVVEEKEVLVYDSLSFVAESGGALGLFLGFSFLTLLDIFEHFVAALYKQIQKLF